MKKLEKLSFSLSDKRKRVLNSSDFEVLSSKTKHLILHNHRLKTAVEEEKEFPDRFFLKKFRQEIDLL